MSTFFFDEFLKDEGRRMDLENAAEVMQRVGVPQLLLEMGGDIAASLPDPSSRDAFHQGYRRCIRDIFFFREVYVEKAFQKPPVNFNAVDQLLKDGTISKSEAEEMRKRKLSGNISVN
jgi:hypothetical protein